jgi:hypothetical protein
LCAKQIGNNDAENVKRKKNARSEVGDCNRQVLRREREEKRNKRTKKIDARPTDQGSECV